MRSSVRLIVHVLLVYLIAISSGCRDDSSNEQPGPTAFAITIDPAKGYQQMIGFGGALTWYSNWVTSSNQKNQIADLLFSDLGIDIIRFKTWYYPDGYPTVTSTAIMSDDNSKLHWDATNELYQLAKNRNPNVKILLSSWGPPSTLKSNNSSRQGTLKKDGATFMYDAYADYWGHTLDNLPFNPDYISIQNEPTYTNSGWTTCEWSFTETSLLPDYNLAFDKVYNKIKDRPNPPIMIGPESQDIPTFSPFANILKDNPNCGILAYHPYNITNSTSEEQIINGLKTIGSYSKPNLMTEFSDNLVSWFSTAQFIQNTLIHANSSGYIYWKLAWATPTSGNPDAGTISVSNATGAYVVTPYFYVLKHFAKHIDAGYQRVEASSANSNVSVSAFKNPAGDKLTVILINKTAGNIRVKFEATGKTITHLGAFQSSESSYNQPVEDISSDNPLKLSAQSITTVVLDI